MSESAPESLRTRLRRLLAWIVASLVGVLLLAEIGLRVFAASRGIDVSTVLGQTNPEGGLYAPHPFIGYTLRPERGVVDNNGQGMRGPETTLAKPAGVERILCLGGSTTYGAGVTAEEAYPWQLRMLLAKDKTAGHRFEVLNCGVPGYTTAETLIDLELRLLEYQPDAVVIYHGINDARFIQARGFKPDYSHIRRPWREPELSGLEWWLWKHSCTYAWLARKYEFGPKSIRLEELLFVDDYASLYEPPEAGVNQVGIDAFMRNIDFMVVLARSRHVEVLLTTFPMRHYAPGARSAAPIDYTATTDALNEALRAYARTEGVPLADLAASMDGQAELFDDQVHMNAQGTRALAGHVLESARAAGLWGLR